MSMNNKRELYWKQTAPKPIHAPRVHTVYISTHSQCTLYTSPCTHSAHIYISMHPQCTYAHLHAPTVHIYTSLCTHSAHIYISMHPQHTYIHLHEPTAHTIYISIHSTHYIHLHAPTVYTVYISMSTERTLYASPVLYSLIPMGHCCISMGCTLSPILLLW